jgi:hypothetical protein
MKPGFDLSIQNLEKAGERGTSKAGADAPKFQPRPFATLMTMPRGDDGPVITGATTK